MKEINKAVFGFIKVVDGASKAFELMAEVSMFAMMAIVFLNVVLRYAFNAPLFWTEEVTALLVAFLTFFAASEMLRIRRHIKLDLLFNRFSERTRYRVDIFISIIGLIFCGIISWQAIDMAKIAYAAHMESSTLLSVPLIIPYSFMGLGMILFFLAFLVRIIKTGLRLE